MERIAAFAGRLGFLTGIAAWGPDPRQPYEHVLAVAVCPRELNPTLRMPRMTYGPPDMRFIAGLDTTVNEAFVGWFPQGGKTMIRWLLPE